MLNIHSLIIISLYHHAKRADFIAILRATNTLSCPTHPHMHQLSIVKAGWGDYLVKTLKQPPGTHSKRTELKKMTIMATTLHNQSNKNQSSKKNEEATKIVHCFSPCMPCRNKRTRCNNTTFLSELRQPLSQKRQKWETGKCDMQHSEEMVE